MNTLILNWRDPKNPKSGGAEIVTIEHAKAWKKAGGEVTWLTSSFKGSKKEESIDGVNIVRRGNWFTVYLFAIFYYISNRNRFDIVIDQIHGFPFFTPLYVRKPKIAFIHEVAGEIWDYMFPFPINIIGKFIESLYFKLYNDIKFWVDADSTIDDLEKHGIKRENCIAIDCPINNKTLDRLPVKEKIPTYIFVSRLVKMKGIEDVIDAFSIINKVEKSNLWIVGGGEEAYVDKLKSKVKSNEIDNQVKFFGYVSSEAKLTLMSKSHILLHASVKEGWGLVVIEAASQGTPSVVYNVSGLKDSVKDGKTGIVVKINNPNELANEATSLLNNKSKYKLFQENGMKWSKSLSWEKSTKESLSLLNAVLRK